MIITKPTLFYFSLPKNDERHSLLSWNKSRRDDIDNPALKLLPTWHRLSFHSVCNSLKDITAIRAPVKSRKFLLMTKVERTRITSR